MSGLPEEIISGIKENEEKKYECVLCQKKLDEKTGICVGLLGYSSCRDCYERFDKIKRYIELSLLSRITYDIEHGG